MDIHKIRKNYLLKKLSRKELDDNPIAMFQKWFAEAVNAQIDEPNAAALATVNERCIPSCRMVLIKHVDNEGFVFFTNYGSRKSHDLEQNPHAAVTLFWKELERQIIIEGQVEKVSLKESQEYFAKRPRGSQISSWASKQGEVVNSREMIEQEYARYEREFEGKEIPLPASWGGFCLKPKRMEFWQGRADRLHDRFSYTHKLDGWLIERLSP